MKMNVNKKDVEKLFDDHEFDIIEDLLKLAYPVTIAKGVIEFFINNEGRKASESLKQYVVGSVMKSIRSYNKDLAVKDFEPYIERRNFFKKRMSKELTSEELIYINACPKAEKNFKKGMKNNISKEAYVTLKNIYEDNKEETYTLIHRTGYEVDPIFENGIRFGSSTFIYDMCQRMDNFYLMLQAISLSSNYKYSEGCFVIKVPKKAITEQSEPIYYEMDNTLYLNPKYIVAYVPVSGRKVLPVEMNSEARDVESKYYFEENVPNVVSTSYHKM